MELPNIINSIFKNLIFHILLIDENGNITYYNNEVAKLIFSSYIKGKKLTSDKIYINEIKKWFCITYNRFNANNQNFIMYQFKDITKEKLESDSLQKVALYDPRTKALNLNGFNLRVDKLRKKNNILSIIMIDLDDFKSINDKYSHSAGDLVLMEVTKIFSKNIKLTDFVCRYGGDEFVIILDNCFKEDAFNVAEKIRKEISETNFNYNDFNFNITVTIGLKECLPTDNFDNILKQADDSLYEGKKNGKNIIIL